MTPWCATVLVVAATACGTDGPSAARTDVKASASPPGPAVTVAEDEMHFDADRCAPGSGLLYVGLGSARFEVLGREEGACVFRYTDEVEGGYSVHRCRVPSGEVSVVDRGTPKPSFDPKTACVHERSGSVFADMQAAIPPPIEEGQTIDGKRQGVWTIWLQPGMKLAEVTYRDGVLDGPSTQFGANDVVVAQGSHRAGKKVGRWIEPSIFGGEKSEEGEYDAGLRVGTWLTRDFEGRVRKSTAYEAGRKDGPHVWFYEDGTKREEGAFADGRKTGVWTQWYPSGAKHEVRSFRDGKEHGVMRRWHHRTGELVLETEYADGVPHGRTRTWSEDGTPIADHRLDHGVLERQRSR